MAEAIDAPRLGALLDQGCARLGLELDADRRDRLLRFIALLHKWNRAYNLTAVRDPEAMIKRHLLDSLSIVPWVRGPRVLDVGAGPGLPGIVLAIFDPSLELTLLDSNGKKVRFQRQAVLELGLANVHPVHERIEAFTDAHGFDQIVSRAFASLDDFIALSRPLLGAGGEWLAMKGRREVDEERAPAGVVIRERISLAVPGEEGARHLLRLAPEHHLDQQGTAS
ncbi:16S rRNA (guanine(527)-N(7))-methyltransferase RsmG [Halotalea alkalilenta]|uniref:Ribosomal RNA small subunit methyltransferase G n=1 Tax=Halotalea alkalilenta TaxID=376489 RepID=A0A172YB38_9GAMM|nr:16S rRNA (guanine(527)-N(7))-methyltransferase RsmG [Halotalea alkalilenta]ANF56414.1 16S rRNA methyltransferase G [Halotalea alkalilenta]